MNITALGHLGGAWCLGTLKPLFLFPSYFSTSEAPLASALLTPADPLSVNTASVSHPLSHYAFL